MTIRVENEIATMEEAISLLMQHMPASKVARLLAAWQIGTGDYLKTREELFTGETVESLFESARARETPPEK
jgi:hypothetical protein